MSAGPLDMTMGALRRAYLSGSARVSEIAAAAMVRLDHPDQDAVWISVADRDRVMAEAAALDARRDEIGALPLYGTFFSVKDNIDVAGLPTTAACPAYAYVPERSATVVERAIAAGAICLGKTNMDQFATGLVGVRSPYGVPKNPFNPAYIPGGSSSGAGVSVSTGAVSFAFGTDTGGSGRVPASYNGIVGLKPAPGDWSRAGLVYACRSFDTPTVFAATIADAMSVDDAVRGFDPADAYSRPATRQPAGQARIAMPLPGDIETFGDTAVAVLYTGARQKIRERFPDLAPVDLAPLQAINDYMFFGPFLSERAVSVGAFIEANRDACHPVVRGLVESSGKFSAADAYRTLYHVEDVRRETARLWDRFDIIATPTVGALVTLAMCEEDPLGPNFRNGHYTNFANPLGLAALAIPAGVSPDGVPWGVTLYAPPDRMATLAATGETLIRALEAP